MSQKILVQISGAGHSGSTLLGGLLGETPGAFYLGEAKKVINIGNMNKPLRKRACKICGDNCERWKGFHFENHASFFQDVSSHMNSEVLIDSSKDLQWISNSNLNSREQGFDVCLILLKRDGRGIVNSRLRKYPEVEPEIAISKWVEKMKSSVSYFQSFRGKKIEVHYEELASNPKKVLQEICSNFNLVYGDSIFQISKHNYHPFGGNNGTQYLFSKGKIDLNQRVKDYYENHSGGIEPDMRWKKELSKENLALFEHIVGDFNKDFKWKTEEK